MARNRRRAYRAVALRWHPDTFARRLGPWLAPDESGAVLARAQRIAQRLNAAWDQHREELEAKI